MSKIVKFEDGTYGVRSFFWPFFQYRDLKSIGYTWSSTSRFFNDCKGTLKECAAFDCGSSNHIVLSNEQIEEELNDNRDSTDSA